jgi:cell division protein FtsN
MASVKKILLWTAGIAAVGGAIYMITRKVGQSNTATGSSSTSSNQQPSDPTTQQSKPSVQQIVQVPATQQPVTISKPATTTVTPVKIAAPITKTPIATSIAVSKGIVKPGTAQVMMNGLSNYYGL